MASSARHHVTFHQGKNFIGDLLNDGKIRWVETGQIFNSPSAWATHCKRLVNPAKKSGCGWASVRYRGQKLAQYKTTWLHKYQPSADMVRKRFYLHHERSFRVGHDYLIVCFADVRAW